jgi:hypothetical protein
MANDYLAAVGRTRAREFITELSSQRKRDWSSHCYSRQLTDQHVGPGTLTSAENMNELRSYGQLAYGGGPTWLARFWSLRR